jgi:glucose-1-phosphate adenylyltransferase
VPAQQQLGDYWYRGTADCVYQNLELIRTHRPKHVLVLAGDHIYKMDYGPMIAQHVNQGADITIGAVQVPIGKAREFGVLTVGAGNQVTRFDEKPSQPAPVPDNPEIALASMGIYVFDGVLLEELLVEDAHNAYSLHDFGRNIIPSVIDRRKVFAYPFTDVKTTAQSYWRDVGTVDAYYDANLELVHVDPELNMYDEEWPIWTYQAHHPPAKFVLNDHGRRGMAINSVVAGGCIISGALIEQSMLFSGVRISERSHVHRSVVLPDCRIGAGCLIQHAILDEGCEVPDGLSIGVDRTADAARFHVTDNGVVLVTPGMLQTLSRPPQ